MMRLKPLLFFIVTLLFAQGHLAAQSFNCPSNIDFELGNLTNWNLYTGSCCPISTPTPGAVSGRHTITSGTATDFYGGFPIVSPAVGFYSMKLGNANTNSEAERARYYIRIPANANNYSVFYRYAVVFQDPNHTPAQQPRFEVSAFDSATGTPIPCTVRSYVASSSLPGFTQSTVDATVWYLPWTISSLNLSGSAGKTIAVDFASGDCALGGHFGYGYIDISCGLFSISNQECNLGGNTTLSAPPGFRLYTWMDSSFTTTVATGQTISIPTPSVTTKYKLILTPYQGFGCTDTLTSVVTVSDLAIKAPNDTMICRNASIKLMSNHTGGIAPYSFSWTPSATVSCSNCDTTNVTPVAPTDYYITVTDSTGCFRKDTVHVVPSPYVTLTKQDVGCFGDSSGSVTAHVQGITPFTYSWNTSPVQTTATASNLKMGNYTVIVTDSISCKDTQTVAITEPTALSISTTKVDVTCHGLNNGSINATVTGGVPPYTYSWNTIPVQTTANITSLYEGVYTLTVTDAHGCVAIHVDTISGPQVLTTVNPGITNVSCHSGNDGALIAGATGGTMPYTYSWNTVPVQTTSSIIGLTAGNYTITITDDHGCSVNATYTVTEPSSLSASITYKKDIDCYDSSTGMAVVVATGGTAPYAYTWNSTPPQTADTAKNLHAGLYNVRVVDNKGCVYNNTYVTLTQNNQILISPTITNVNCYGESNGGINISVSGGLPTYTYSWNTSPVRTTANINNVTAGNYTLTVTDSKSCVMSKTITVTEPALLVAAIAKTDVTCNGKGDGTATANVTGGTAAYTYSWNTTPVQTSTNISSLVPGNYSVFVTDNHGCTASASTTITEPAVLRSSILHTNVSCYGGSDATATVTPTGGNSPYTYRWNSSPVQTTANANSLNAGPYNVMVTDSKGCTYQDTVTIGQPTALAVAPSTVKNISCYGRTDGSIVITASGGTSPYSYLWTTISPLNFTATATNLAVGTYPVKVSDAKGCNLTISVPITQPVQLTSSATSTDVTCFGANNGTASVTASGGTTPYKYSWNTYPVQTTANPSGIGPGSYTVTVTDTNGCTSTSRINITQPAALTIADSTKSINCYGGNDGYINIKASGGVAPYTYSWNTIPPQTTTTLAGLKSGSYTITLTDANNCTLLKSYSLTQPAKLSAIVHADSGTCQENANGSGYVNVLGGVKPYKIMWSDPANSTTTTIAKLNAGKYGVMITDSNGCVMKDTLTIPLLPSPVLSIKLSDTVICAGTAVVMTASGGVRYKWTPPADLLCDTCDTNVFTLPNTATYTLTGYNAFGCKDTALATIKVINRSAASVGEEVKICIGDKAQLSANGGISYNWTPATTLNVPDSSSPVAKPDSTTIYQVVIKENKCFTDTLQQQVTVYPYPIVDAGPDVVGVPGASMQFTATASNAERYEWTPNTWLSCADCLDPTVTPKATQKYTLKAISPGGCYATDTVTARIACDGNTAYLPNTFSPNGDGQNDIFYPRGDGFTTIMNFRVIDRWGEMLFSANNFMANDKAFGWDGTYHNTPVAPGVYVYVLEIGCPNNTTSIIKGNITLLR